VATCTNAGRAACRAAVTAGRSVARLAPRRDGADAARTSGRARRCERRVHERLPERAEQRLPQVRRGDRASCKLPGPSMAGGRSRPGRSAQPRRQEHHRLPLHLSDPAGQLNRRNELHREAREFGRGAGCSPCDHAHAQRGQLAAPDRRSRLVSRPRHASVANGPDLVEPIGTSRSWFSFFQYRLGFSVWIR
jgi:hypothetical protein